MKLKNLIALFTILVLLQAHAQSEPNNVLITIDGDSIESSEFIRVYNKNLELVVDESQKNIEEYLKLFINYKLKLKEAVSLGLHNKPNYLQEFSNYKKQLAKSYMKDSKVTEALVQEAYQRISYDVKASHILVRVSETASPKDTLAAFNSITKLRKRAVDEGFESVRASVHDGQKIYGEKLGYFSGFKMVYDFENVAFNTPVGEISQPFRTSFGYHILHVLDKRKSQGERTVAHIMLLNKSRDSLALDPELKIQELYKKLKQGESFEALAKQFSEDKNSSVKGGLLPPFGRGQLNVQEFEDISFGLTSIDDVSEPFKTNYGWHIVTLKEIKPLPEFETMKSELVEKVTRDDRSKLIDQDIISKLKKRYLISSVQPALNYFEALFLEDTSQTTWQLPARFLADKPLVKIGNKQFLYHDFADYLIKSTPRQRSSENIKAVLASAYQTFLSDNLIAYHEDNLEFENESFAHIVSEYREGLLLFELMENTIWNASETDSVEIQNYYITNKDNYKTPKRISGVIASSTKRKTLKKTSKLLANGETIENIKKMVNTKNKIEVVFSQGVFEKNHQSLPSNFEYQKGISKIYSHNKAFVLVQVNDVTEPILKTFEESKGNVISDYQNFKESNWLIDLKEKYPVIIHQEALKAVKQHINKS